MCTYFHTPVLVSEVVQNMNLQPKGVYLDCTLGGAGHSIAMLEKDPSISLYCFDRDESAIRHSQKRLIPYKKQVCFIHDNFSNIMTRLALRKIGSVDGILMDLGVSSHQISDSNRGFSFTHDELLDMRMDTSDSSEKNNAYYIINNYKLEELQNIFYLYGEERYSKRIASNIINKRNIKEIRTTKELADIIEQSVPDKSKISLTKSKARIFQAIRITVNNELKILPSSLFDAISILKPGRRLLVISWHSLEDRITKDCFRYEATSCVCPIDLPVCACKHRKRVNLITKKPITPSENEVNQNPNSRSAKLRIVEKI